MLHLLLAEAATASCPTTAGSGGGLMQFMPMIIIFVIFYFLMIYPQQKKMKKHRAMVAALKAGDSVITTSGIVGTISKVEAGTILLTIAKGVDIEVTKGSVGVVNDQSAEQPTCCSN